MNSCMTCKYWENRILGVPAEPYHPGWCHRRAPVRVVDGHSVTPGWPPTLGSDGCGEHQLTPPKVTP